MNTDLFFQAILDAIEDEGINLTQEQVDLIQRRSSELADELVAE